VKNSGGGIKGEVGSAAKQKRWKYNIGEERSRRLSKCNDEKRASPVVLDALSSIRHLPTPRDEVKTTEHKKN